MSKSRLLASSTHAPVAMRARLGRVFLSIADDWGLPIADLSTVATVSTPPGVGAPTALGPMPPWKITAEPELQLAESYPALVLDEVPAVRGAQSMPSVKKPTFDWYSKVRLETPFLELLIAQADKPPCLGALVKVVGSAGGKGEWKLSLECISPVTITKLKKSGTTQKASAVALKRSLDQAPERALEELKKAFATYARSDKFRAANKCADFEAERAAAISSVEALLDFLPSPKQAKAHAMPSHNRFRLDDD